MNKIPIKTGEALLQYMPQRHPFIMVDQLFEVTDKMVESGLSITKENILVEDEKLRPGGMIENMAQTCALFAGYRAAELGKAAPVGFIAAVKDVAIKARPEVGATINTKIEIVNELMNMQIARAMMYNDRQEVLGGCELRVFIKEEG